VAGYRLDVQIGRGGMAVVYRPRCLDFAEALRAACLPGPATTGPADTSPATAGPAAAGPAEPDPADELGTALSYGAYDEGRGVVHRTPADRHSPPVRHADRDAVRRHGDR
jgi:hypothetical protein